MEHGTGEYGRYANNSATAGFLPGTLPAQLAATLRTLIVPGVADSTDYWGRTEGTPAKLAIMLADLAARLATLELPPGEELSLAVAFQPSLMRGTWGPEHDAARCAVVDAVAAFVLPGVTAKREAMTNTTVHYTAQAHTPAGLAVSMTTRVEDQS